MWRCNGIAYVDLANLQASIIGKKYGTRRWPRTKKTIEGSLAFAIAVILGAVLLTDILPRLPYFTSDLNIDWGTFLISTILTGTILLKLCANYSVTRSNVVTER